MDIQKAIKDRRLIEISLFNEKLFYTGVCVKLTKEVIIMIDFNFDNLTFDGVSVFKYTDLDSFEVYGKKDLKPKVNNLAEHILNIPAIESDFSFEACVKAFSLTKLVAIFLKKKSDEYLIGKVVSSNDKYIDTQLFTKKGKLGTRKKIEIKKIKCLSFDSSYEKSLLKKINS